MPTYHTRSLGSPRTWLKSVVDPLGIKLNRSIEFLEFPTAQCSSASSEVKQDESSCSPVRWINIWTQTLQVLPHHNGVFILITSLSSSHCLTVHSYQWYLHNTHPRTGATHKYTYTHEDGFFFFPRWLVHRKLLKKICSGKQTPRKTNNKVAWSEFYRFLFKTFWVGISMKYVTQGRFWLKCWQFMQTGL